MFQEQHERSSALLAFKQRAVAQYSNLGYRLESDLELVRQAVWLNGVGSCEVAYAAR